MKQIPLACYKHQLGAPEGGLHGTVHLRSTFLRLQQNEGQLPAGQSEIDRLSPCCKFLFTCVTGKQTIHPSPISSEPPSLGGPYLTWDYFEDSHCVPQPGPDTCQGCTVFAGGFKGWWTPPLQLCQRKSTGHIPSWGGNL